MNEEQYLSQDERLKPNVCEQVDWPVWRGWIQGAKAIRKTQCKMVETTILAGAISCKESEEMQIEGVEKRLV